MSLYLVPKSLLYVEAVADHGSIQAAARTIRISASAIDRQIKLIEDRLGTLLFDRQPTGMTLTTAGEMFVLLARRWQEDETRLLSDIRQMQGVDFGHVRLVAMDSLVNGLVPRFLKSVAEEYPRVRVDVEIATPDGAAELLDSGQCELALCFNLRPSRDIHVLWSAPLPLYCVVAPGHPLAQETSVSLSQVRTHAIAVQSRALAIRRMLEARHSWMFEDGPPPVVTNSLHAASQATGHRRPSSCADLRDGCSARASIGPDARDTGHRHQHRGANHRDRRQCAPKLATYCVDPGGAPRQRSRQPAGEPAQPTIGPCSGRRGFVTRGRYDAPVPFPEHRLRSMEYCEF